MSRDLDKFYTKDNIVLKLLNIISKKIDIKNKDLIIEPSAGNGVFSNKLKNIYKENKVLAFDIKPENNKIIKKNFLQIDNNKYKKKTIHFIGNPPFGAQSGLAKQFIKKCILMNAETISFILAKSFKKNSMKKIFPLNYSLLYQVNIPDNSFLLDNKDYNVPCVFQIWVKNNKLRKPDKILVSKFFIFCKKNESPDYSIRRIGWYAGNIFSSSATASAMADKSENSHYFIKLKENIDKTKFFDLYLNKIKFTHNDTVGPRSISKRELIIKTNKLFL
jgi:hypothetical protein